MAQLELKNVSKSFGDTAVIHGLDLTVKHGEFCVFVGPSGCGKSTLLRMIAGLEECTGGDVLMDNDDVTDHQPAKRGIAMVFQSYALYPHMTVAENLGFGLKIAKVDAAIVAGKVAAAAKTLQIEHLLKRKPKDLSGGQRQRVAIGRAIVREPRMFLFDEPLSNLDAALRVEMRVELAKIKTQLNTTVVYVTHDQVEAMTLADKIVVLRDGRIEQVGSPLDLYASPVNQFVAGFIGSPKMNFLSGTALSQHARELAVLLTSSATVRGPCGAPVSVGTALTFGIRPEHLSVVSPVPGELQGDVFVVERLGGETYFHIRVGDQNVIAKVDGDACAGVGVGNKVGLSFDINRAHFFLKSGLRVQ